MVEFRRCRLADVCESIDYGYTASASVAPVGPKFLRITDIVGPALDWTSVPHVDGSIASLSRYRLHDGDIVIARTGATTGESRFIQNPPEAVFASYLVRLKINDNVDPRYVAYWLKSSAFRDYLHGVLGDKSAQPNASAATMTKAPMLVPLDRKYQASIAATLGVLDDRIEVNRRMNETLEAMAGAIFRDWFVDFGPTRAKAEGRTPYLASELWALFPDRLDNEKPEPWELSTIGSEVDVQGGSTPSTKQPEYWGGEFCWATPKDLAERRAPVLLETERHISKTGLAQISSGLLPVGTVLLSSRAPIGYIAIAQVPTAVNQGFIAMMCRNRLSNVFVWLWTHANMKAILQNANGSTFQEISKSNFRPIPVVVPSEAALAAFDAVARPMFDRIVANEQEARTLGATRDLLLPKLMSGEIRVKEAEKMVGAVL